MRRELFFIMGGRGINRSAGIDNSGNGNIHWKGQKRKKGRKSQAFRVYCFQCCVIILFLIKKKKKECKGIKSAMNITGLHSHFRTSSDLGCVHLGDRFSCASSERLFLHVDECWELRWVALGWFQGQI